MQVQGGCRVLLRQADLLPSGMLRLQSVALQARCGLLWLGSASAFLKTSGHLIHPTEPAASSVLTNEDDAGLQLLSQGEERPDGLVGVAIPLGLKLGGQDVQEPGARLLGKCL